MQVGGTVDVIDGVMLNTSIEHPSTTELGEEGERAARGCLSGCVWCRGRVLC